MACVSAVGADRMTVRIVSIGTALFLPFHAGEVQLYPVDDKYNKTHAADRVESGPDLTLTWAIWR